MDWRFVDSNTIQDHETGYVIKLLGGTWFNPREIKPMAPKNMPFLKQAELLRCGMEYVNELCSGQQSVDSCSV